MTPASTAAPAAKTTRLEVSLSRSGKIEHHDFIFELPEGMDPKEFLNTDPQIPEPDVYGCA